MKKVSLASYDIMVKTFVLDMFGTSDWPGHSSVPRYVRWKDFDFELYFSGIQAVLGLWHWKVVLPTEELKKPKKNKDKEKDPANDFTTIADDGYGVDDDDVDFCECVELGTHHSTASSSAPLGLPIVETFTTIVKKTRSTTTTSHDALPMVNSLASKVKPSTSTTTKSSAKRDLETKDEATETGEKKQIKRRHTV